MPLPNRDPSVTGSKHHLTNVDYEKPSSMGPSNEEKCWQDHQQAHNSDHREHQSGQLAAAQRREEIQSESLELLKAHNDLDNRLQGARENHNRVLSEQRQAAERDVRQHLKELDAAEIRRNHAQDERVGEIKTFIPIDDRLDQALEKQAALAADYAERVRQDVDEHSRGLDGAAKRRESLKSTSLEKLKAHNDLDRKVEQAQRKHDELLRAEQRALAKDARMHEQELRKAEERRVSLQHLNAVNRLDEKVERAQEKHLHLLEEEMERKEHDAREHDVEIKNAEERRDQSRRESLEHLRQFNALNEKISIAQERHQQVLEQRQRELQQDVQAHDRALHSAGERRQSTSERNVSALRAHNDTDAKFSRALERRERTEAERQKPAEQNVEAHERTLETAEECRARLAAESRERLKEANATDKKTPQAQAAHRQAFVEEKINKEDVRKRENTHVQSAESQPGSYTAATFGSLTDKSKSDEVPRSSSDRSTGDAEKGNGRNLTERKETLVNV